MLAGAGNKGGIVTYTNTQYHNNLVVKHDSNHPIGGFSWGAKDAFEEAEWANQEQREWEFKLQKTLTMQ